MLKPSQTKIKRAIFFVLVAILVLTNFYGVLLLKPKPAQAEMVPVAESGPLLTEVLGYHGKQEAQRLLDKIEAELKAVFFKNVLGTLANTIAKMTATWVASGGKGGATQWISNLNTILKDYPDAAMGDFLETVFKDLTGINICTVDPRLAINISLQIPFFPDYTPPKPACTFSQLRSHWEEIGKTLMQRFSFNFDVTQGGTFAENVDKMDTMVKYDPTLQVWDDTLQPYLGGYGCTSYAQNKIKCNPNPIQTALAGKADRLNALTANMKADIDTLLSYGASDTPACLADIDGKAHMCLQAVEENIPQFKKVWTDLVATDTAQLDTLVKFYGGCQNKSALELTKTACQPVLNDLGITAPDPTTLSGNAQINAIFASEVNAKIAYVFNVTNYLKSGYSYLSSQIDQAFSPDLFKGSVAYNANLVKDLFKPSANEFNAYDQIAKEILNKGIESFINTHFQAMVNQGWKSATTRIADLVTTPSDLLRAEAQQELVANGKTSRYYTANIKADALGVFLETLYNELMRKLLAALNPQPAQEETRQKLAAQSLTEEVPVIPPFNPFNPFEQGITSTPEGIQSYLDKMSQRFTANYSYENLDLLTEFQTQVSGEVNPNIYNNVIDPNLALAISSKKTIKQAIIDGQLVGNYTFSWSDKLEPGTYNLANIKKLRKARVVPLGLELAAELVRDCNYRKDQGYADFRDITGSRLNGGVPDDILTNERLQNCLFRPAASPDDVAMAKDYNVNKIKDVLNATLSDVVDGFDKSGTGTCGDGDATESPFCNLVDPNWVLKIPLTRCQLETDAEPYGEVLESNATGTRYSRCPDFVSCLREDGKGGCVEDKYGICVKEKNSWDLGTNDCPAQFNSCRTYTTTASGGTVAVSYLKNTLSGAQICGPNNAGCSWYATKSTIGNLWQDFSSLGNAACLAAAGTWVEGACQAERIYFDSYVQSCDKKSEGCSKFYLYRDPANNLVKDSSFEYTDEGAFPQSWDLILKREVGAGKEITREADCSAINNAAFGCTNEGDCGFYGTCFNYSYGSASDCQVNNGQWLGSCQNLPSGVSLLDPTSQNECTAKGGNWAYQCVGALNNQVSPTDCASNGGTYKQYCLTSVLQYNLCDNPQLPTQSDCTANGGTWQTNCEINPPSTQPLNETDCQANGGNWVVSCQGASLYNVTKKTCAGYSGSWRGYGPFGGLYGFCTNKAYKDKASCEAANESWLTGKRAEVSKNGENVQIGLAKLKINLENLGSDDEYLLLYKSKFADNSQSLLTKGGDVYTATAYVSANPPLAVNFSLIKNYLTNFINLQNEVNTKHFDVAAAYNQIDSTLVTTQNGTQLDLLLNLPGNQGRGAAVYLDAVALYLNSQNQVSNLNFVSPYTDYTSNTSVYYKKPPERLNCHGYGPGDPPPVVEGVTTKESCESIQIKGYWDAPASGIGVYVPDKTGLCYKYKPDDPACSNFAKVCQPEEVGCQIYTPMNGDPEIPAAVNATDYCPAECVGYATYKQDPTEYEPNPVTPYQYFIPATATVCTLDQVGCSQFTNLDEVAKGGEGIEYFTYLKQCVKPAEFISKTYFTWQGSASGPPQPVKFVFQQDANSGAPKMTDSSADCRVTLGEDDFNCVKFFDSDGNIYYRDITKAVTVSDDCHPYRKTESNEANCQDTNGIWQSETSSCLYNAIPSENLACGAQANGCRAYVGDRGNNVYVASFDNFEDISSLSWYTNLTGQETGSLTRVGESVVVGGHSLFMPTSVSAIHKFINLGKGGLYNLSFWAKTDKSEGENISIKFSTAVSDNNASTLEDFATLENKKVKLTNQWQNYNLGPVYVSWDNVDGNSLNFDNLAGGVYFDNILLKVVKDNIYVVKDSWQTPASCDKDYYGAEEKGAMLGCQAYKDSNGAMNNLKSFASLCRASTVGCQILFDTQNSINPNSQSFNTNNASLLDDYEVPADKLTTLVLNSNYACDATDKGCQRLGRPNYQSMIVNSFNDVYLKNDPDKYINVPKAIMCNDEALGCSALVNDTGVTEYYKIEPDKLCQYGQNIVNSQTVEGWFKNGSLKLGCGTLGQEGTPVAACQDLGGGWSTKYDQCTMILSDINDQDGCLAKNGEWLNNKCLAFPFTIYKAYEANKYKGYSGLCDDKWNGCTEFKDVNPNFVFNGSFETIANNGVANWHWQAASTGTQNFETTSVQDGKQAVKIIKTTSQTCPTTYIYPNASCSLDELVVPSFSLVSDPIALLKRGKTYKISFYYRVPAEAKGTGDTCQLPEAAFSFNRRVANADGTLTIEAGPLNVYASETDWKKVETLFTVPAGDDLQNFELQLYGPLNYNNSAQIGNCPDSYIEYDQVEVKDNTEDSYYTLDVGSNLDRASCTAVNWDTGCVQFYNTSDDVYELLKVNRDRNCDQWVVCTNKDANGNCTSLDLCQDEKSGQCLELAPKSDNVRYDLDKNPLPVKRISDFTKQTGYIYRFGSGALTNLVSWRAGDYSGYTLADRLPLETELSKNFVDYPAINDLGTKEDPRAIKPICKVFPSSDSPLPADLAAQPAYKNLLNLYSPTYSLAGRSPLSDLGNMCSYEKVSSGGLDTYVPIGSSTTSICVSPEAAKGRECNNNDADCGCAATVVGGQTFSSCCQLIGTAKVFYGLEGMCLEYDLLNPVYDGIYQSSFNESTCSDGQYKNETDCKAIPHTTNSWMIKTYNYQPYACLTYFPFLLDLCSYHSTADCANNPDCKVAGPFCVPK